MKKILFSFLVSILLIAGGSSWAGPLNPAITKLTTSDAIKDFVVSGLVGSKPGSGLAMTTPSGTVILGGSRLNIASDGGHTYTASKDTYVDLSSAAVFTYTAVNNGAAAPALAAGALRLEKVVTNGTDITSVTSAYVQTNNVSLNNSGGFVFAGHMASSEVSPSASILVDFYDNAIDPATQGQAVGLYVGEEITPSANTTNAIRSLFFRAENLGNKNIGAVEGLYGNAIAGGSSPAVVTEAYGLYGQAGVTGSNSVATAYAEKGLAYDSNATAAVTTLGAQTLIVENLGAGTVTNANPLVIKTTVNSGGGTITNNVGLTVQDQHAVGTTIHRNFWSKGASSDNLLEGTLTVNGTTVLNGITYPTTCATSDLVYGSNGTTLACLATANNGVLITSAGGVPSIASTLPAAVQANITSLGTIASGVWNGTAIGTQYGGSGINSSGVTDGQLLIGQTSDHTFGLAAITAGSNITVTNAGHSITIAASGGGTDYSILVTDSAAQTLGAGDVALAFDTETFKSNITHSTVTNNSRITFSHAGKYKIECASEFTANAANSNYMYIRLNGATVISPIYYNGTDKIFHADVLYNAAANDYVECMVNFNGGVTAQSGHTPMFWAFALPAQ